ncbi:bifunctional glutamate N-acetyltransferase/amino-acid acetyltransferase ArgJ [Micromonospora endophytica]|uniref:Arginine biosynthesis bifunctional protein ArgJ n=1 Tax=Micromonospora endophytica TaxID=515350 RepID=A0A2W2D3B7_9ACTN|nr:bifunctional glutamate N-acetyltransferase/amino-acid acetyltransferase ArgJ [Micromonospora endophytica]PZF95099.1 bifunctional ornithine acetyltransferase/N-acetylglutamate synthase [Micromonospora endophytica]RIW49922.1 bifunctional glutamate N-acetyltransferase/amino-acid acetyltransferase ArgJ [Micromonospora endophytica]BCJ57126.1 arginine biosynthesis bifunctional protein ArgJ [Micromonospora endophytica]
MSVTTPRGFRAAGVAAGLKSGDARDVALVVNDGPDAAAAGVFTTNRVKAAPVLWSEQVVRGGVVRAVVLNSGGANACTGPAGFQDTHATAEHTAATLTASGLEIGAGEVAICSTGLIGERLPMAKLLSGVDAAGQALSPEGGDAAAEAIMTTDTRPKTTVVTGDGWTVGGMAKGAGMLAPGMATMLCVLTTDAVAGRETLDVALRAATRVTFDRVDSDGCMSTNDTVLLLASGTAGVEPSAAELTAAVTAACHDLAQQLLADAEGATKEVAIEVVGAADEDDAVEVGRSVARNNLVKTALFGNDPNWGRILAAVGTTAAAFDPAAVDVAVNGIWVCRSGAAAEDRSKVDLTGRGVTIRIDLHAGVAAATIWTNDLSHAYVHENSAYST